MVIWCREDQASQGAQHCEDVPGKMEKEREKGKREEGGRGKRGRGERRRGRRRGRGERGRERGGEGGQGGGERDRKGRREGTFIQLSLSTYHSLPSPWTGSILASVQPSTELPNGLQKVDVVATHKVLCQVDDG